MRIFIVILCIVMLFGCNNAAVVAVTPEPATAAPTIAAPDLSPTPSPKPTDAPVPSNTPEPTPVPVDMYWDVLGLPPPLSEEPSREFAANVAPFCTVRTRGWMPDGFLEINVDMAFVGGEPRALIDFDYGNPPMPLFDYIEYMDGKYLQYGENPFVNLHHYRDDDDLNWLREIEIDDWFFESDLLNRNMRFWVYNRQGEFIGNGRIASTPLFITYYHEAFFTAEFEFEDDSITVDDETALYAVTGDWNPFLAKPVWSEDWQSFTIDINGKGRILKGEITYPDPETREDDFDAKLTLTYRSKQLEIDMGYLDDMYESDPETFEVNWREHPSYSSSLSFYDQNGDGIMEMIQFNDYDGGWSEITFSFDSGKPKEVLSQWGRW